MSKLSGPEIGSYTGGVVSIASALTLTEWGILVGIATALLTFGLNVWYTRQKNAREQMLAELDRREHEARFRQLEGGK